jgi:DNA-binding NarL/FixJ family response regulator
MDAVLASADSDLRVAVEIMLREEPDINVVGTASDAASLRALVRTFDPGLVVLDGDLPGSPLKSTLAEMIATGCPPQVIVFGKQAELEPSVLASGANAFVLKGSPPSQLLTAIRQARSRTVSAEKRRLQDTDGEWL